MRSVELAAEVESKCLAGSPLEFDLMEASRLCGLLVFSSVLGGLRTRGMLTTFRIDVMGLSSPSEGVKGASDVRDRHHGRTDDTHFDESIVVNGDSSPNRH